MREIDVENETACILGASEFCMQKSKEKINVSMCLPIILLFYPCGHVHFYFSRYCITYSCNLGCTLSRILLITDILFLNFVFTKNQ